MTATVTSTVSTYSEETLKNMTIAEIKAVADELGYTITKTIKADIIEEFLQQQNKGNTL
ncbi:MAG: hypothetical protein HFE59_04775 [Clostridiales bacterium]|nr:hypothetical protein [Clostridiales bacterium]